MFAQRSTDVIRYPFFHGSILAYRGAHGPRALLAVATALMVTACGSSSSNEVASDEVTAVTYVGTWTRSFLAGPGNPHTVTYVVKADSIRYTIVGNVGNADYAMIRDAYVVNDQRFVGHTEAGEFYVIFARDISDTSIRLYKQTVADKTAGLGLAEPEGDTTENHGWNVYTRQAE